MTLVMYNYVFHVRLHHCAFQQHVRLHGAQDDNNKMNTNDNNKNDNNNNNYNS